MMLRFARMISLFLSLNNIGNFIATFLGKDLEKPPPIRPSTPRIRLGTFAVDVHI